MATAIPTIRRPLTGPAGAQPYSGPNAVGGGNAGSLRQRMQNAAPHPSAPKPGPNNPVGPMVYPAPPGGLQGIANKLQGPKPPAPSLPRQPGQVRIPGQPQVQAPGTPVYNRPPQPPSPGPNEHYTWVNGKGWQLIHPVGPADRTHPLGRWAPGPMPRPAPPDPTKSTYGLNLGDKTPYNVFGGPKTQGDFNRILLSLAQSQYLPQLQDIQGQQSAENLATKQRSADIGSIYSQYGNQAQQAFQEVQSALHDLAVQNAGGDATAQANLGAALKSAQGGQGSLDQMMGLSGPGADQTLPYLGAAADVAQAGQQQEANLGTGTMGLAGANLTNVGNERATEQNTESLRHGAAIQGLESQQSALVAQIPGIIEKTRQDLITNLQSSQALQFQQNLANNQFGLQSQAQQFNQNQTQAQFKETQVNDASNRAAQAATILQNAQALANQQAATQAAAATALTKAQGQAQANAIKWVQSWLAPTKEETTTWKGPQGVNHTALANPKAWHRDVGTALRSIMQLYGLSEDEALTILESVGGATPISGQGGQTVAEWAYTFHSRQSTQGGTGGKVGSGVSGLGSGIVGKFKL